MSIRKKSFNGNLPAAAFVFLSAFAFATFFVSGCDMLGGDSSDGTAVTAQYSISGTILSPLTNAPLSGVACTLSSDASAGVSAFIDPVSYSKTAVTDANGAYSFAGVPAGKYKLASSGTGLVPTTTKFSVDSDTKQLIKQISKNEWSQLAGNDNPYDPNKAYITVHTDAYPPLSAGTEDGGVTVELKRSAATNENQPAAYEAKGHFAADGTIDWAATKTYDSGLTFFKGVAANQPHTITAQKSGYTFETATDAMASPGEVANVILKGASIPDGFPVTIINNSGYKTSEIYLAVIGQDSSANYYYYDPKTKDMKIGTSDTAGTNWCFPFTSLESTVENQFVYNHPFKNMIGGRVWVFFNQKGVFGVNNNDARQMVQPSHLGSFQNTIFDKIELTCDGTNVTSNTTIVDFLSIAFKLKSANGGEKGFNVATNDEIANVFLARTDDWKNCVVKDGKGNIIRVLCPRDMSVFSKHLDTAIANGWSHYTTNEINFSYSNWTYRGYVDTVEGSVNKGKMVFKVVAGVGTGKADVGDTYVIDSVPTTKVVWDCDGAPLSNDPALAPKSAQRNLHACICAALNRGVFCSTDWGKTADFYKTTAMNDGKYNNFAQVLHEKATNNLVYGFPYDDHFGKDPTFTIPYSEARKGVTITIPKMPAYIK